MNEHQPPEDPIWSRWRERHGQGNGAPPRETAPEPFEAEPARGSEPEPERIRLGDPLDPDWASGARANQPPEPDFPPTDDAAHAHAHVEPECLEWCPICRGAEVVRATFPPEIRSQLEGVQRDALVAMRSVLDHYIERVDAAGRPSTRVEDIPIR